MDLAGVEAGAVALAGAGKKAKAETKAVDEIVHAFNTSPHSRSIID